MKYYSIPVPSNTEIYRDNFIKLVTFDLLKPERVIQLFVPSFNLMTYMNGKEAMVVNKAQEASIINDLQVYLFIAAIFVFVILILVVGTVVLRSQRERILEVLS
jgi:hypothetical protein